MGSLYEMEVRLEETTNALLEDLDRNILAINCISENIRATTLVIPRVKDPNTIVKLQQLFDVIAKSLQTAQSLHDEIGQIILDRARETELGWIQIYSNDDPTFDEELSVPYE